MPAATALTDAPNYPAEDFSPMMPRFIGPALMAKDDQGRLLSRIATVFPDDNTIVTLPGIHATQREAYMAVLDEERRAAGQPPMPADVRVARWFHAVDLIVEEESVLIRPDRENMPLAFAADEVLQQVVPKSQIRFLNALDPKVRDAIKTRGECWRITALPTSTEEMKEMILGSRINIGGQEIYYYSKVAGIRWLTCQEFERLGLMSDDDLRLHLTEIWQYSVGSRNSQKRDVDFFLASPAFRGELAAVDFTALDSQALRLAHQTLLEKFVDGVPSDVRQDDVENPEWRRRMFAALVPHGEDVVSEEQLLGLGAEFFMQIKWLPGGRIEGGELILDASLEDPRPARFNTEPAAIEYSTARSLLFNLVREYGDLEYLNLGRVVVSMARRPASGGRRGVYVVQMKRRDSAEEFLKIIRMQKWGVREHLDEGKKLLQAMLDSEEYTEYILDRRLACRQLGMNLPVQVVTRKISELYFGRQKNCWNTWIWSPYFERDYIRGIATDMVPQCRFENPEYAMRFASLLGREAAPSMIVGRQCQDGTVIFDNGDEVVLEDAQGLPVDMMAADHTGAFADFETEMCQFAPAYAEPVNSRIQFVANPGAFAAEYIRACLANFARIQHEYRTRRRSFDSLFKDRPRDEAGSLAFRWERVLHRLDATDLDQLEAALRSNVIGGCGSLSLAGTR